MGSTSNFFIFFKASYNKTLFLDLVFVISGKNQGPINVCYQPQPSASADNTVLSEPSWFPVKTSHYTLMNYTHTQTPCHILHTIPDAALEHHLAECIKK